MRVITQNSVLSGIPVHAAMSMKFVKPAHSNQLIYSILSVTRRSSALVSTSPGMPETHPQYFRWGDVNENFPQYYYILSDIADQYKMSSPNDNHVNCAERSLTAEHGEGSGKRQVQAVIHGR